MIKFALGIDEDLHTYQSFKGLKIFFFFFSQYYQVHAYSYHKTSYNTVAYI